MTAAPPGGPVERVVLTGFMGAGKSTVGPLLAGKLGWPFQDVDQQLALEAVMPIASIFTLHGEAHFRALEAAKIADLLQQDRTVLALGGGALEDRGTCARLAASTGTLLVYLQSTLAIALARCKAEPGAAARPLLHDSALEARFASRIAAYEQAHLTIDTGALAPDAVAERIAAAVREADPRASRQNASPIHANPGS